MNPRPLSVREVQVIELVAEGLSNDAIAAKLYLTPDSVKTYLERVGDKAGTRRSRAALVNWAWTNNYIGDRSDLQDQIDNLKRRVEDLRASTVTSEEVTELRNTIANLRAMYATACGFQGWTP